MSIKEELSKMSFSVAVENSPKEQARIRGAIDMVIKTMKKRKWEGVSPSKIREATSLVQLLCPSVCWRLAVNEGINEYLKEA